MFSLFRGREKVKTIGVVLTIADVSVTVPAFAKEESMRTCSKCKGKKTVQVRLKTTGGRGVLMDATCDACNGMGRIGGKRVCRTCNGRKKVPKPFGLSGGRRVQVEVDCPDCNASVTVG